MATRLTRPNVTFAIAYENAFDDYTAPTAAELNERRFVHLISCGLTEDGTELTLSGFESDDTTTFCDTGQNPTLTFPNITSTLTWLKDENTGGSGSTVDLTSLYNKIESFLGMQGTKFWVIQRTGPEASQDINFAIGHKINMALFETDYPQTLLEQNRPARGVQNLLFQGSYLWNANIAS